MQLYPSTQAIHLRICVIGMAIGCLIVSLLSLYDLITFGAYSQAVINLLVFVPAATGLWRLAQWGRWLAMGLLWLYVVLTLTPFGVLSIYAEINGEGLPRPIWAEMTHVGPVAVLIIYFLEVLHSYRGEFRFSRNHPAAADLAPRRNTPPSSWPLWVLAVVAVPTITVFMVTWGLENMGGCIPLADSPTTAIPIVPSLPVISLGMLLFWRASTRDSSGRSKLLRVAVYGVLLFLFRVAVGSYVWYYSRCPIQR